MFREGEDRSGGVFPWSSFSCEPSRARAPAVIPLVWRLRTGGRETPSHTVARRPPGRSRAQERPEAEAAELSGRRGAGAGGQPPPILAGSAPSRPGAARGPGSCLSPPSSTVGATLSSQGAGEVEVGGRRLGPWAGRRGALRLGDPPRRGWHPPARGRAAGRAPSREGSAPKTFGGWGTERKPPASPGGIQIFRGRSTVLPRHARSLWNITPLSVGG